MDYYYFQANRISEPEEVNMHMDHVWNIKLVILLLKLNLTSSGTVMDAFDIVKTEVFTDCDPEAAASGQQQEMGDT